MSFQDIPVVYVRLICIQSQTIVTNIVWVYIPNSIEEATVVVRDDSSYDNSFRIQRRLLH